MILVRQPLQPTAAHCEYTRRRLTKAISQVLAELDLTAAARRAGVSSAFVQGDRFQQASSLADAILTAFHTCPVHEFSVPNGISSWGDLLKCTRLSDTKEYMSGLVFGGVFVELFNIALLTDLYGCGSYPVQSYVNTWQSLYTPGSDCNYAYSHMTELFWQLKPNFATDVAIELSCTMWPDEGEGVGPFGPEFIIKLIDCAHEEGVLDAEDIRESVPDLSALLNVLYSSDLRARFRGEEKYLFVVAVTIWRMLGGYPGGHEGCWHDRLERWLKSEPWY